MCIEADWLQELYVPITALVTAGCVSGSKDFAGRMDTGHVFAGQRVICSCRRHGYPLKVQQISTQFKKKRRNWFAPLEKRVFNPVLALLCGLYVWLLQCLQNF